MFKDFSRKYISAFALVSFCALAAALLIKLTAVIFSPFADFFNRYISFIPRGILAYATALIPFSLAEAIIIMAIPLALIYIIYCATVAARRGKLMRHIFNLLGTISLVISLFIINFGIAYDCTPIEKKLEIETGNLTVEDVFNASKIVLEEIKEVEASLERNKNGEAISPYSFDEMKWALVSEYEKNVKGLQLCFAAIGLAKAHCAFAADALYRHCRRIHLFHRRSQCKHMPIKLCSVLYRSA